MTRFLFRRKNKFRRKTKGVIPNERSEEGSSAGFGGRSEYHRRSLAFGFGMTRFLRGKNKGVIPNERT